MSVVEIVSPQSEDVPLAIEPQNSEAALTDARQRDPRGHNWHVIAACGFSLALGLSAAATSVMYIVLAVITIIRLPHTRHTYRFLIHDRVGFLLLAWAIWQAISLGWSPDWQHGIEEMRSLRMLAIPLMIWPVIDHVGWIIASFLCGVAIQNIAQLGEAVHLIPRRPGDNQRLRGVTHPIVTATFCLIAMCLHLSATLNTKGKFRNTALAGLIAAGLGLIFTGSRGPWLAAAITMPIALLVIAIRRPNTRKFALVLVLIGAASAAAAWPFAHRLIEYRIDRTQTDLEHVEQGRYGMDVGHRLACWNAAWEMFTARPLIGVGTGGYKLAASESTYARELANAEHAHSMYLHVLASTGAIGMTLLGWAIIVALRRAWKQPRDHPYVDGIFFAMIGWLIAVVFDASQLGGESLGVLILLISATLPLRPRDQSFPAILLQSDPTTAT